MATDVLEAREALQLTAVHMATAGHHLAAFCAMGCAQALAGEFVFRDTAGAAQIALRAFPFFSSGPTVTALEVQ